MDSAVLAALSNKKDCTEPVQPFKQRYQDSNLENAGVRVQCLTVWR